MTRKEYLDSPRPREAAHRAFYAQFVDKDIKQRVLRSIGLKALRESTREALNDIPLERWDRLFFGVPKWIDIKMRELGDWPTPAGLICIAKEAARQILEAAE